MAAEKYAAKFFGESAIPSGVLTSDRRIDAERAAHLKARDGVPLGLSVGFAEVPGGNRWSADRQRVTRTSAALDHVAVVRVPAYTGAGVVGVRGASCDARPTPVLLTLVRKRR